MARIVKYNLKQIVNIVRYEATVIQGKVVEKCGINIRFAAIQTDGRPIDYMKEFDTEFERDAFADEVERLMDLKTMHSFD